MLDELEVDAALEVCTSFDFLAAGTGFEPARVLPVVVAFWPEVDDRTVFDVPDPTVSPFSGSTTAPSLTKRDFRVLFTLVGLRLSERLDSLPFSPTRYLLSCRRALQEASRNKSTSLKLVNLSDVTQQRC